jgi:hypothetical protein
MGKIKDEKGDIVSISILNESGVAKCCWGPLEKLKKLSNKPLKAAFNSRRQRKT